jgi:hypothetical protein
MTRQEILDNLLKVDLLGLTSILLVILITYLMALRWPAISKILIVALVIRVFTLLLGAYFINLPDSEMDARTFEVIGFEWSKDGFFNLPKYYPGASSYFISWIIAIPYSLFGRSMVMAQSISLLIGISSIYIGCLLAQKLWDESSAIKFGWVAALFPSLVLYSVLNMREIYIVFFILISLHGVVGWINSKSFKMFVLAMIGFIGATFFHGGMVIGTFVFLFIILITSFKTAIKLFSQAMLGVKTYIMLFMTLIVFGYYFAGKINIPKVGQFSSLSTINKNILEYIGHNTSGEASFPEWIIPRNSIELVYKAPPKVAYFLFSPFPWDVKKTNQLIGMFDGFFYMYFTFLIFRNIKIIWRDDNLRAILLILLSYIIVFGLVVGNFGTSIRHRLKFFLAILLLISPFIPKIKLFKKTLRNKSKF